uniref:Uncharacterized protein n=1 Tax=Solanum tuberosum TaxID=4113 RepID=M1DFH7_SOLTU
MPNYGRERLNARFSITMTELKYLKLKNFNDTTNFKNAQLRGFMRIMSMNYSTQGLKDTSHLKTARLIGFMRNYGHEQFNSKTSWVTCNSPMIRIIISEGLGTRYSRLRT